jgi:hypothetical protein
LSLLDRTPTKRRKRKTSNTNPSPLQQFSPLNNNNKDVVNTTSAPPSSKKKSNSNLAAVAAAAQNVQNMQQINFNMNPIQGVSKVFNYSLDRLM